MRVPGHGETHGVRLETSTHLSQSPWLGINVVPPSTMAKHEIETVVVESWGALLENVFRDAWQPELERFRSPHVFRGMGCATSDLSTTLSRLARGRRDIDKLEGHLLRNFRKYAHKDAAAGDSVWNWLALAAHHGLPTRLLDWSYSPFVALHFATVNLGLYDQDAVVWCINHGETNRRLPKKLRTYLEKEGSAVFTVEMMSEIASTLQKLEDFSKDDFVVFLEPPSLDERILNQFALFSMMSTPDRDLQEWLARNPGLGRRIIIAADLKWEIRDKLDQAGISERILFPGLDGLTAWLTRYYSLRAGKNTAQMEDDRPIESRPR